MDQTRPRVLLIYRCIVLKKDKILIIQRSDKSSWNQNLWEFPGGKLDEGQDVSNALEREVVEETSLLIKVISPLSYIESFILSDQVGGKYRGMPYILIAGIGRVIGGEVKLEKSHQKFKWVTAKQALDMDLTLECRKALLALQKTL